MKYPLSILIQVMGGINAMHQYQTFFGMSSAGASTGYVFYWKK